jgi:hypothetical protein
MFMRRFRITMVGLLLLALLGDIALLGGRPWAYEHYGKPSVATYIHDIDYAREIVARYEVSQGAEYGLEYRGAKSALGDAPLLRDCWVGSIVSENTDHPCLDRRGYTRVRFVVCPLTPSSREPCSMY